MTGERPLSRNASAMMLARGDSASPTMTAVPDEGRGRGVSAPIGAGAGPTRNVRTHSPSPGTDCNWICREPIATLCEPSGDSCWSTASTSAVNVAFASAAGSPFGVRFARLAISSTNSPTLMESRLRSSRSRLSEAITDSGKPVRLAIQLVANARSESLSISVSFAGSGAGGTGAVTSTG